MSTDQGLQWRIELLSLPSRLAGTRDRRVGTDATQRVGSLAGPARMVARPAIRFLARSQIFGLENIPIDGPAIICANHRSFFDTPLLMVTASRPITFLGKAEYMDKWLTRHLFPALGMVPIKRDAARSSMAALETAADLLRDGQLVGIYPEGTRSRDGMLHRGHTGVAHLAMSTGAPIVPVGLTGTQRVQPIGATLPRPFRGPIGVRFGSPIEPHTYRAGGSRTRRRHLVDDVMASIASMTDQERSAEFASDEAPLVRGGSESVYLVERHRAGGTGWREAAAHVITDVCTSYDDARVGEVRRLQCRLDAAGEFCFDIELGLTTRFSGGSPQRVTGGTS